MRAAFGQFPLIEHQDHIGIGDGRKAVRNAQRGPPFGDRMQGRQNVLLSARVQGTGGFIEQQDRRVLDQGAGNRDALFLAARQFQPALDEATSALDSRTEEAIQATLDGVVRNRTTIVIAHRLSTIVGADQIVVLDEGRVAERGTHGELLAKGGLYAELWTRQAAERELQDIVE